jgi:hypothetical protein
MYDAGVPVQFALMRSSLSGSVKEGFTMRDEKEKA